MRKSKIFIVAFLCALSTVLYAAASKTAVVDMEILFQGYYKTKLIDAKLKEQAEVFKAYSEKLMESRMKLEEEFKDLRDASQNVALNDGEREQKRIEAQQKYRDLKEKEAELTQYNKEKQFQLKNEYEKNRKDILEEIRKEIKRQCVLEGYTLVLDCSGRTLNNIPGVIYFNPSMDITPKVLTELNRGHKEEKDKKNKKQGADNEKS